MEEKEIEIRSDEVQEILTEVPNWMIRYGITLIFGIIAVALILFWFIKYPETVAGNAEITTEPPPVELVAKTAGYIQNLAYPDNATIRKGQVIAELSNPIAKATMDSLKNFLSTFTLDSAVYRAQKLAKLRALGQAQNEVNALYNLLVEYHRLVHDTSFIATVQSLDDQMKYNNRLAYLSRKQFKLYSTELKSATEKYRSDSVLYVRDVIAKTTWFERQSAFFAKKQTLLNAKKAAVQYQITATDYAEQKNKLLKVRADTKRKLTNDISAAVKSLLTFADTWKLNYIIEAPIAGKLAYLSNLSENEFVKTEQPLFAVVPDNDHIIGIVRIDKEGFGKIKTGQQVRIKLNNYPYQEFGQLTGQITSVSTIAGAEGYIVKVNFEHGLITTYHKHLSYKPGMTGAAEVITEDLRLLERMFNSIRKIFER